MPFIHFSNQVFSGYSNATQNTKQKITMKPLFTAQSSVYYKPHSLASGGVGTVRNSRSKARFT
jgi:hypothetical protein|uniref:Uncharacterized protein n=1 Tax=viral metagenome TaxID=1070528 RepID=A0A6C0DM35_9ZZZZ